MFRLRARTSRPAYPRLRRENSWDATAIAVSFGSPPHTRGKRPARAGKTALAASLTRIRRAHPRSRGENHRIKSVAASVTGSSPLAPGKPQVTVEGTVEEGLIPAHAGKTITLGILKRPSWAHPRSGGENTVTSVRSTLPSGSSPLAQGKPVEHAVLEAVVGLIPARAGKTTGPSATRTIRRAHPRSRGENYVRREPVQPHQGSSPLTRGKRYLHDQGIADRGLIPTHAGKMATRPRPPSNPTAHPHSRGENAPHGSRKIVCPGSSPLTRGKLSP